MGGLEGHAFHAATVGPSTGGGVSPSRPPVTSDELVNYSEKIRVKEDHESDTCGLEIATGSTFIHPD